MALSIPQESNDDLVVKLLGIANVGVYYDDMTFTTDETEVTLKPTSAVVTLSEDVYGGVEPTDDQKFAVRQWVARKTGVDAGDVQIA
jgi:hypothetical protein